MSEIRRTPIDSPLAWTAAEVADRERWTHSLDAAQREALVELAADAGRRGLRTVDATREDVPLPALDDTLEAIHRELEGGLGFAVLRGVPVDALPWGTEIGGLEAAFWALACAIGYPEAQDGAGNRLHHVRAVKAPDFTGDANVRAYETNVRIDFHTDGSDALMFLCRRQGRSGGTTRLVSAVTAFNAVVARRPDLAAVLQRPFAFDVRGQRPDGARVQRVPIFVHHAGRLNVLYKRGYIELAQRFPEVGPLGEIQREALDALDAALADPAHYLEFTLEPGEVLFANNYGILHARTRFEDWDDLEHMRHFLRIWLTLRDGRPLPPEYADTREYAPAWQRKQALAQSGSI